MGHNILKWTVLVSIKWANCPVFIIYHACHDPVNNRCMTKNCTWRASTNCKGGGGGVGGGWFGDGWDTTLQKTKGAMLVGVEVVGGQQTEREEVIQRGMWRGECRAIMWEAKGTDLAQPDLCCHHHWQHLWGWLGHHSPKDERSNAGHQFVCSGSATADQRSHPHPSHPPSH